MYLDLMEIIDRLKKEFYKNKRIFTGPTLLPTLKSRKYVCLYVCMCVCVRVCVHAYVCRNPSVIYKYYLATSYNLTTKTKAQKTNKCG